jgi:cation transport regulator ChaB
MSSETTKDFQKYAQDCVKLAQQPNTPPELRQQLFQMAREWMQAMMAEEDDGGGRRREHYSEEKAAACTYR